MTIELKIPDVGESINEVEIIRWLKKEGDSIKKDEALVELQTDKAAMELPSPISGILKQISKKTGEVAKIGSVIGLIDEKNGQKTEVAAKPAAKVEKAAEKKVEEERPAQRSTVTASVKTEERKPAVEARPASSSDAPRVARPATPPKTPMNEKDNSAPQEEPPAEGKTAFARQDEKVPMTPIRKYIAEKLVQAQHDAALLTTFNEVDMSQVQELRQRYQDDFVKKHGIKLGFMSFFVKASIEALKKFPELNSEIQDKYIVYHNYFDIGIAIGIESKLVVPVLRNAERLSFAEIEKNITDFAVRAKNNTLKSEELRGGTFTITNGGVFGSLFSTPILNPPQSGILGMHTIQDRPVAIQGNVVVRPMMYIALTYDHRIVDGREAVLFLRSIKENIENPSRILLEL